MQIFKFIKKIKYYIMIFLILELLFISTIMSNKLEKEKKYRDRMVSYLYSEYLSTIDKYQLITNTIFKREINRKKILEIINEANFTSKNGKKSLREKLFLYLNDTYLYLKSIGFNIFHFHLINGESFLRFHKPAKFGDYLFDKRYSLKLVNQKKKFICGYEKGKIISGLRYIYPLFFNGKYIGSMEFMLSIERILNGIKKIFPATYQFIIKKDIVKAKTWDKYYKNYISSDISNDFLYQKNLFENMSSVDKRRVKRLNLKIRDEFLKKLKEDSTFSKFETSNGKFYLITAIPIFNFEDKKIAYILSYKNVEDMKFAEKNFLIVNSMFTIFLILVLFFIYKIFRKNEILFKKEQKLEKITDNIGEGLILFGKDGKVTFFNPSAQKILGYSEREVANLTLNDFISTIECGENCCSNILQNKQLIKIEDEYLNGKNRKIPVEKFILKFNEIDKDNCCLIGFRDISEKTKFINKLKKKNEILEISKNRALQAIKARESFIANISHELRTPLNSIINFTDIIIEDFEEMLDDKELQDEYKFYLTRSLENSKHLLSLINDILDFSRAEAGKIVYDMKIQNIVPIIIDISDSLKNLAIQKNLKFRVEINFDSIFVKIDEKRLKQIIDNLVSNAIKFTSNGFVLICLTREKKRVILKIIDSGKGIDDSKKETIFNPFEQINSFDTGSGLGLSLVKTMCKDMQIKLSFTSKVDMGTTFELEFYESN